MVAAALREGVDKEVLRHGLAKGLGLSPDAFAFLDPEALSQPERPVFIECFWYEKGFHLAVHLHSKEEALPSLKTDLDLARLLVKRFRQDVLVWATAPKFPGAKTENFHGLLLRPDGSAFRVPLVEGDGDGVDIPRDPALWEPWKLPAH